MRDERRPPRSEPQRGHRRAASVAARRGRTLPQATSEIVEIRVEFDLAFTLRAIGRRTIRASVRVDAPHGVDMAGRRVYMYRLRKGAKRGVRIRVLRLRPSKPRSLPRDGAAAERAAGRAGPRTSASPSARSWFAPLAPTGIETSVRVRLIAFVAASALPLVACGGEDPKAPSKPSRASGTATPQRSATIDVARGTYKGVGIGSTHRHAARRLGRSRRGLDEPLAPLGHRSGLDIGIPPSPQEPTNLDPMAVWRFRNVALVGDRGRAWLAAISAKDAVTDRGVGVGSTMAEVRSAYPGLECGTANESTEYAQFSYCTGRVERGRHLWFGDDPVRSVTISRAPLT